MEMLSTLQHLQQQRDFADFTIHLKDGSVRVSRILIAAMSPVFRKMLTMDMAEKRNGEVNLKHVSRRLWTCITEFYLGSKKLITVENVAEVIHLCDLYEMTRLKRCCSEFLLSCCCSDNCIAVKRIASQFRLVAPERRAVHVMAGNFSSVCKSSDFLLLEEGELLELLEKENLSVLEDDLCQALLTWMEAKGANEDTCAKLFKHINLKEISDDCIGGLVLYHSVLARAPAARSCVQEEMVRRLKFSATRYAPSPVLKRHPVVLKSGLVIAGRNVSSGFCMYCWVPSELRWCRFPSPHRDIKWDFSAVVSEGSVVVTGGDYARSTALFDLKTRTWSAGPNMLHGRSCHGMAHVHDAVYAVAGDGLVSVEKHVRGTGRWVHVGDLHVPSDECGVTALGDNILVVGGSTEEAASLVQTFNVVTRTPAILDVQLPRPMRHVRAASLGNTAYFVGSEGDLVQVREVEGSLQVTSHVQLNDFGMKSWFGLCVAEDCVRIIGGCGSQSVSCWSLQGYRTQGDEIGTLPLKMAVYATLTADLTVPQTG